MACIPRDITIEAIAKCRHRLYGLNLVAARMAKFLKLIWESFGNRRFHFWYLVVA